MNDQPNNIRPLLQGLAAVPVIDIVMCLGTHEIETLFDLVLRGAMAASGFSSAPFTERDLADAEHLAQALSINPTTGEHQASPSKAEIDEQIEAERLDRFLDDLAHAGE